MFWDDFGRGRFWSSFRELDRMREDMDRLFSGLRWGAVSREFPPVNLWTGREGAQLSVELPGVDPKDVDVSVVGDTVTVKGERKAEELKKEAAYHRQERRFGTFARSIRLPFEIDGGKVDASFRKGVLYLTLPPSEEARPKRIAVKST